jgi:hypothetical protein
MRASYRSDQNIWSSYLLSKKLIKIKNYNYACFYGCKLSLSTQEKRLRIFQNKALRSDKVTERWRKLPKRNFCKFYHKSQMK